MKKCSIIILFAVIACSHVESIPNPVPQPLLGGIINGIHGLPSLLVQILNALSTTVNNLLQPTEVEVQVIFNISLARNSSSVLNVLNNIQDMFNALRNLSVEYPNIFLSTNREQAINKSVGFLNELIEKFLSIKLFVQNNFNSSQQNIFNASEVALATLAGGFGFTCDCNGCSGGSFSGGAAQSSASSQNFFSNSNAGLGSTAISNFAGNISAATFTFLQSLEFNSPSIIANDILNDLRNAVNRFEFLLTNFDSNINIKYQENLLPRIFEIFIGFPISIGLEDINITNNAISRQATTNFSIWIDSIDITVQENPNALQFALN